MRRSLLVLVLATLTAAAAGQAAGGPFVSNCGKLVVRPVVLTIACADANYQLRRLRWTAWGGSDARATGRASVNLCKPNCAAGKTKSFAVFVVLDRATRCGSVKRYLRFTVVYIGPPPPGIKSRDVSTRTCKY